ncbi:hypothetical protein H257_07050 [Aphanomyces astaci]|uniref:HTH CENPB-type domain-containing protein n=1 Tax=Aphanomyces astaci TaxID=112090 RepID=W4GLB5_APHAT|nr:hypothetical protein H257_07050 [Aphanomyces astaci]ETV79834.1 hypothetical protein H257_07050 [Aphanomyces astaci]|eukprot:XP_009830770.1 hypothetical protein H257_07050 [Aphanomyces astaci]
MRTTLTFQAEEQLLHWVIDMRKDGVPVTHSMLRIMVLEAAIDLGHEDHETVRRCLNPSRSTFKPSCWNNIDCVYYADQTRVNYEYLPTKTLNPTGDKTIWVKCVGKTKERVTAMLLAD